MMLDKCVTSNVFARVLVVFSSLRTDGGMDPWEPVGAQEAVQGQWTVKDSETWSMD